MLGRGKQWIVSVFPVSVLRICVFSEDSLLTRGHLISFPPSLCVQFAKAILMDYYFEEVQSLKVVVYDVDSELRIEDLSRHDLLGEVEVTLADIISAGQTLSKSLTVKGMWCPTRLVCAHAPSCICTYICVYSMYCAV